MDECSLLHESTEDYGAKRSEQRTGMGMELGFAGRIRPLACIAR